VLFSFGASAPPIYVDWMVPATERVVCRTCGRVFSEGERFCPFDRTDLQAERRTGDDPLLGTVLAGSYTLIEKLGVGGMGVVYKARQHRLERNVALKLLSSRVGPDAAAAERFRTEALAVSQLSNPHTVAIHDFGSTEDGLLYLVMHLVEGESLRSRLLRGRPPLRSSVSIAAQVCESLAEAHERQPQIIHRDIKPDNIIVRRTADGEEFATVLDFGLAKLADSDRLTAEGLIVGTPAYMAPEQARNEKRLDGRVDLYALGVVLFEMLTGRPPFSGPNAAAVLYEQVWTPPPALRAFVDVPPGLDRLVTELLAKGAEDRPATASGVRARLLEVLKQLPEDDAPPPGVVLPAEPAQTTGLAPMTPSHRPPNVAREAATAPAATRRGAGAWLLGAAAVAAVAAALLLTLRPRQRADARVAPTAALAPVPLPVAEPPGTPAEIPPAILPRPVAHAAGREAPVSDEGEDDRARPTGEEAGEGWAESVGPREKACAGLSVD